MLLLGHGLLQAQGCKAADAAWSSPGQTPTLLAIIVGNQEDLSFKAWGLLAEGIPAENIGPRAIHFLRAYKTAEARAALAPRVAALQAIYADSTQDSIAADDLATLEVAGMGAILGMDMTEAVDVLTMATRLNHGATYCRCRIALLVARYLQAYNTEAPLWPYFNGGFYNYLQDSLRWKADAANPEEYVTALTVVSQLYRLRSSRGELFMEMLGDLLSKEPNRFTANYLASLAYMRAGLLDPKHQESYERKALFALEAPHQSEQRFNLYRFTQLKKALAMDVDSAGARLQRLVKTEGEILREGGDVFARFGGKWNQAPITTGFVESDLGKLPAMLAQSKSQLAAHEAEVKRYAGDVDLKVEVKKDNRFNSYALILIGMIVVAVIFIWRQLIRAAKTKK